MQKGSVNKVILVGHLGGDPESRFTQGGTAVATFSVATNESRKNSEGNWEDHTEWHRCVLFGKQAETAAEYIKKRFVDLNIRPFDENGYLNEPFYLLPIGFIFICLSMVLYIVFAITKKK